MEMQPEWIGRQAQCPYCKELFIVQGAMNPMQYQAPNPPNAYNQGSISILKIQIPKMLIIKAINLLHRMIILPT
ncbi:MAG: hypothetical protein IKP58_13550 [Victivallales bacterium]|nr:hypothetical protein [Victivallales bacterium]